MRRRGSCRHSLAVDSVIRFFSPFFLPFFVCTSLWCKCSCVAQLADKSLYIIAVDVPGCQESDVSATVLPDNQLEIHAFRRFPKFPPGAGAHADAESSVLDYRLVEHAYGKQSRLFKLPSDSCGTDFSCVLSTFLPYFFSV